VRCTCILLRCGNDVVADALLGRFLPRLGPPVATQAASFVFRRASISGIFDSASAFTIDKDRAAASLYCNFGDFPRNSSSDLQGSFLLQGRCLLGQFWLSFAPDVTTERSPATSAADAPIISLDLGRFWKNSRLLYYYLATPI